MAERLTAKKCAVKELLEGAYVAKEGTAPNHVLTPRGEVSRANVIAAVIDRPGKTAILLDDGSGQIEARAFDDEKLFENILLGDVLLVVGRPREYQGRRYLVAEIAKRLGTPKWLELRHAELGRLPPSPRSPQPVKEAPQPVLPTVEETVTVGRTEKVIALIRRLDAGQGASVDDIVAELGAGAEGTLTTLMAEGEIFEMRPGRVKVLE